MKYKTGKIAHLSDKTKTRHPNCKREQKKHPSRTNNNSTHATILMVYNHTRMKGKKKGPALINSIIQFAP